MTAQEEIKYFEGLNVALEWVQGDSAFNMRGAYLTDEVTCPVCKCPTQFEFIESFSSQAKCIVGCVHLHERDFREDGNNWYGFA